MKKLESLMLVTVAGLVMGSCGKKQVQQAESMDSAPSESLDINRDSTLYGICGDGSAMNTLQLVTDIGDTLMLNIAEANAKGNCFGGFQSGDRMAVILADKITARQVINQSALLGDWVMPNPIDGSSEMGIRIKEGGVAESIEQPSLIYRSWRLVNGKLEIVAIREVANDEVETNLYDLVSVGPDTLVYKDSEETFTYSRYREHKSKVNIEFEKASEEDFRI